MEPDYQAHQMLQVAQDKAIFEFYKAPMKKFILTLSSLLFVASAHAGDFLGQKDEERMDPEADNCGMAGFEPYIGQHIDEVPDALRTRENGAIRILPPGAIVTMDFRLDRLNVYLDEDGIIQRLKCG